MAKLRIEIEEDMIYNVYLDGDWICGGTSYYVPDTGEWIQCRVHEKLADRKGY